MAHRMWIVGLLAVVHGVGATRRGAAQESRAEPSFVTAVRRGTRTLTGRPGPGYWQQWATYRIAARLDAGDRTIDGEESVRYYNHSPDTLRQLAVQLYQNLHTASGAYLTRYSVTGGVRLKSVAAAGVALPEGRSADHPGYQVTGTVAWLRLPRPLAPRDSVDLSFEWRFQMPEIAPRMGTDGEVYMVGYWYPQVAVYDDVNGWQTDRYTGRGEFYMGYADYDVTVDVPEGWLVGATGELANPGDVLTDSVALRALQSTVGREVVHVVAEDQRGAGRATRTGESGRLRWHFLADRTRDFAWVASSQYLWDATSVRVAGARGDSNTVTVNALYRPSARAWSAADGFAARVMTYYSGYLWPYPYPQLTVAEGPWGGMEYPMFTVVWPFRDTVDLFTVMAHEIGHMWFPMQVGSDEKRVPWMDEGLTQFDGDMAVRELTHPADDPMLRDVDAYLGVARQHHEEPMSTHADGIPGPAWGAAAYFKPVAMLRALRGMLGDSVFMTAYRAYGRRWFLRHPTPIDFAQTFSDVSGQMLDWFWRQWMPGTAVHDLVLKRVATAGDSIEVVVENRGGLTLPAIVEVRRADSTRQRVTIPVDEWLRGTRRVTLRFVNAPRVVEVVIDPDRWFPAINRNAQRWPDSY
jgi:hypothetical protein